MPTYHIPAPPGRFPTPGTSYCGAERGPWHKHPPSAMRLWVCERVLAGFSKEFCAICLGLMLKDATRPEESGRIGGLVRRARLSPEERHRIAVRAATLRWARARSPEPPSGPTSDDRPPKSGD